MKVSLLMAITLDGKIAKYSDHLPDWTEKADKKLFVEVTKKAGVMIMGSKTYDTFNKPLPGRKNIVMTRNKDRISDHKDLLYTDEPPKKILANLKKEGFRELDQKEVKKQPYRTIYSLPECMKEKRKMKNKRKGL